MEEKKPQDLEINGEETNQIAEFADTIEEADREEAEEIEAEEIEAEEIEVADNVSVADESNVEEEWIEETPEAEPVKEESAEELITEAPTKEDVEEALTIEEETVVQEVSEEEPIVESSTEKVKSDAAQIEKTLAKQAVAGIVIKPWQLAVATAAVVAMVFGSIAFGIALGNKNQPDFNDSPVDYEWVLPEGGSTNEGQIVLPGYDKLVIPAGEKQIEIVLPNPKGNPCYFRYTLVLEETGEILYQSKLIPPGKAVLQIELSRPLPIGDYVLLIGIDSISLVDGRTPMNGGEGRALLQVR